MFWNGKTAIEGLSGSAGLTDRFSGPVGSADAIGFAWAGTPTCIEYTRICSEIFLSWIGPRSVTAKSSFVFT